MLSGGALWAQAEKSVRAIGQVGSDIPTCMPCLVCCVVEPLPTLDLAVSRIKVQITLTLIAVEEEHHKGVAAIRLVNVELLFGHWCCSHEKCAESPNDPKLSDRGARHGTCMAGGKAEVEAGAVTPGVRYSAWLGAGW